MTNKKMEFEFEPDLDISSNCQNDISESIEEQVEREIKKRGFSIDDLDTWHSKNKVIVKLKKVV